MGIEYGVSLYTRAVENAAFAERFKSQAEVELNGGVVDGVSIDNEKVVLNRDSNSLYYNNIDISNSDSWTLLFDLDINTLPGAAEGVINQSNSVWADASWAVYAFTDNKLTFANKSKAGAIRSFSTVSTLSASLSISVALVVDYSATTRASFYINGVLDNSTTDVLIDSMISTDNPLRIGKYFSAGNSIDGAVSNVKIFNEAKTAEEILAYYNNTMWSYDKDCVLFMNGLLHEYSPDSVEVATALVDGDMEAAGVSAWTAGGGAALSKVSSSLAGSTLAMRVAGAGGYFTQALSVGGLKVRVTGYARGDGTSIPELREPVGAAKIWIGTNSTDWQPFTVDFVPGANFSPLFWCLGGSWAEFDEITIVELQSVHEDKSRSSNDLTIEGATKVNGGYSFDGTNDYMVKYLGSTPDVFTISIMFNWNSNDSANLLFAFYNSSKKYFLLTKSSNTIFIGQNNKYAGILTGYYSNLNSRNILTFVFQPASDSVDIYLNGEFIETKTGGTLEAITGADVANNVFVGGSTATSQYSESTVNNFAFYGAALNPTQIRDLHYRMEAIYSEGRQGR